MNAHLQVIAVSAMLYKIVPICSQYISFNDPINVKGLNNLIKQFPKAFILIADSNRHKMIWVRLQTKEESP